MTEIAPAHDLYEWEGDRVHPRPGPLLDRPDPTRLDPTPVTTSMLLPHRLPSRSTPDRPFEAPARPGPDRRARALSPRGPTRPMPASTAGVPGAPRRSEPISDTTSQHKHQRTNRLQRSLPSGSLRTDRAPARSPFPRRFRPRLASPGSGACLEALCGANPFCPPPFIATHSKKTVSRNRPRFASGAPTASRADSDPEPVPTCTRCDRPPIGEAIPPARASPAGGGGPIGPVRRVGANPFRPDSESPTHDYKTTCASTPVPHVGAPAASRPGILP
ncbi:hypothetical protein ElP_09050 [Tautonia plasticadhaerens]|uniref:Uncharacterized protein n=1 Tax=Tautonia plasticadhaerens TaxID=2527974 RepID=A0A518GWU8_9BACT|nr:hypothetical protein ElP_09050 [Tautonia plasticadhaerens]